LRPGLRWARAGATALALLAAVVAHAGLPCLVDGNGVPLRWNMPVVYNLDPGLASHEGAPLVLAATEAWQHVATAQVQFVPGPPLPVAVDVGNYTQYFGRCGDGLSPIIFDADGSIIDDIAGAGASQFILGLTFPDCGTDRAPAIPETSVLINGAVFALGNEGGRAALTQVITHELGHVLNLCHTRLNASFLNDGNAANDAYLPIMFPILSDDASTYDPTPRFDDRTMLSLLYPAPGFFAATGTISGHVLSGEQAAPVSGATLVVRNLADPLATAEWTSSGWLKIEGTGDLRGPVGDIVRAIDGSYQTSGLTPGSYSVELESGLVGEPGEFYSGASESGDPVSDPPDLSVPVDVGPGTVRTDITILLAERVRSLLGETDWDVTWRGKVRVRGRSRRIPADALPAGRLELFSTGSYLVTPVSPLNGSWRAHGKRAIRLDVDLAQVATLFGNDTSIAFTNVRGAARADAALKRIRGAIVVHGHLLAPRRVPFTIVFSYRGTRALADRVPGRLPIISPQ
jgi:hypothetical protein